MARSSRWTKEDRAKLFQEVQNGVAEQEIRKMFTTGGPGGGVRDMTSVEFAQQLKQAMVEAGIIKQSREGVLQRNTYEVTSSGRLNITDFAQITGYKPGTVFSVESPRGRSKAWRLVPLDS